MSRLKADRRASDPLEGLPPELAAGFWAWAAAHMCADCRARLPEHGPLAPYPCCHARYGAMIDAHLDAIGWTGSLPERIALRMAIRGIGGHNPPPDWPENVPQRP